MIGCHYEASLSATSPAEGGSACFGGVFTSQMENGHKNVSLDIMDAFAGCFKTSLSDAALNIRSRTNRQLANRIGEFYSPGVSYRLSADSR